LKGSAKGVWSNLMRQSPKRRFLAPTGLQQTSPGQCPGNSSWAHDQALSGRNKRESSLITTWLGGAKPRAPGRSPPSPHPSPQKGARATSLPFATPGKEAGGSLGLASPRRGEVGRRPGEGVRAVVISEKSPTNCFILRANRWLNVVRRLRDRTWAVEWRPS